MILLSNENDDFKLTLKLNVEYEPASIEVVVYFRYRRKGTAETRTFSASRFDEAVALYRKYEAMFF